MKLCFRIFGLGPSGVRFDKVFAKVETQQWMFNKGDGYTPWEIVSMESRNPGTSQGQRCNGF